MAAAAEKPRRICEKCERDQGITKHHVFPRRFFKGEPRQKPMYLCRSCHDEIEKIIPRTEILDRYEYVEIAASFVGKPVEELAVVYLDI